MYLGACTKGANKNSLREQPFSNVKAMQRAYSLKASYMTVLVRKLFNQEKVVSFVEARELKEKTLEQILWERFEPFFGMNVQQISGKIGYQINTSNKSTIANMVSHILGISGTKLNDIEEFAKANIQFKTIRLEPNGFPKESMSFENIDFGRWLEDDWEESQVREKFETTKFLFVVFQYDESKNENPNRVPYFKTIKLWNMPEMVIENELKDVWVEVRKILVEGVQLIEKGNRVYNNLPKSSFNGVVHLRPKARDGSDKTRLPDGQYITRQCYWLDRKYIAKILSESELQ